VSLAPAVLAQVYRFAGGPVDISCAPSVDGWSALTWKVERRIVVLDSLCSAADRFAQNPVLPVKRGDPLSDPAFAALVIIHETQHIAHPEYSEAVANCAALDLVATFSTALGSSRKTAPRMFLRARYWTTRQPAEYQSRCTAGTTATGKIRDPGLVLRPSLRG
jgi:hypothetical protein